MSLEERLWCEKYRPAIIDDCVLPKQSKKLFKEFVAKEYIPNLLLTGTAGVGKTTVAKAMLNQIGLDYIVINGSMNAGIDHLRNDISTYASTVSLMGGRKYIILDEADYLSANKVQPALRNFMEEFSANCGFILTCNWKNRIIAPLHSRCSVMEFHIPNDEKVQMIKDIFARLEDILKLEHIEYDKKVLLALIRKYFPDFRRTINELQKYSVTGKIDTGILTAVSTEKFSGLLKFLKQRDFDGFREWVGMNTDADSVEIMRYVYDNAEGIMTKPGIAQLILIIGRYQYQNAFVADPEVNLLACLTEICADCEMK